MMVGSPSAASGTVKAIDRQSVHRICSGQVVLNLATAVKELVENSLDAGATNVDIRLKDYGSEVLEVADNGSGVEKTNFLGLTLKHHTSKLQDFSDLSSVDTFGFRGEALSSLCALSDMTVVTCHKTAGVGAKLEYDHDGVVVRQTPCPRQCGTTVTLQNLFSTLPVRHKEFLRNLKREFSKMVQLLQAYGLISSGVKLTCTNQVGQGKRSMVLSTSGNTLLKENIANVFGPKQLQSLLEFCQGSPTSEQCEEYGLTAQQLQDQLFRITGYISKSDHGSGRSVGDRQYYYVNKRPCDFPKVSKVVNEVYHMYNRHQYPFVVMDISLAKDSVDVNVTPDKRKIFVLEEKSLLVILKASLHQMFEPRSSLYDDVSKTNLLSSSEKTGQTETGGSLRQLARPLGGNGMFPTGGRKPDFKGLKAALAGLKRSYSHGNSTSCNHSSSEEDMKEGRRAKQPRLDEFLVKRSISDPSTTPRHLFSSRLPSDNNSPERSDDNHSGKSQTSIAGSSMTDSDTGQNVGLLQPEEGSRSDGFSEQSIDTARVSDVTPYEASEMPDASCRKDNLGLEGGRLSSGTNRIITKAQLVMDDSHTQPRPSTRREVQVPFSIEALHKRQTQTEESTCGSKSLGRTFKAAITPSENSNAEEELKKHISKDVFPGMEILGQFNLGFIIAKHQRDLFIIDQHATDEKYNFEMLQKHTVLQGQRLIQPLPLELTAVNEAILQENMDIFKKNGFDFSINEEAPPTQRLKLTSLPTSKNWTFGKEDIDELIFMLSDCPGVMCRPSRVRQMFASRSCRKSIMIGTALSKPDMRKLLCHMAEIDQPWNCPHGRPTMRHLFDLNMLPD